MEDPCFLFQSIKPDFDLQPDLPVPLADVCGTEHEKQVDQYTRL